jgi:hypothetical protein
MSWIGDSEVNTIGKHVSDLSRCGLFLYRCKGWFLGIVAVLTAAGQDAT